MKKKKIYFIIIIIAIAIFIAFMIFNKKEPQNNNHNNFDIIIPSKETDKEYLFYYKNYFYYLNYDVNNSYMVRSTDNSFINDEVRKEAYVAINDNLNSFKYNDIKYEITPLKRALYDFKIDISWAKEKIEIISEEVKHEYAEIEIEQDNKINEFKLYNYDKMSNSSIYLKNINIKNIKVDNKVYNKISDIANYNNDTFIEQVDNIWELQEVYVYGGNIISARKYFIDNMNIYIETKYENKAINYYISLDLSQS